MDAGAFSDDTVVKASEGMVRVLVDSGRDGSLFEKYGVRSMPTILFLDSDGKQVGKLGGRDPKSVETQFTEISTKHARGPKFSDDVAKSLEQAKSETKPLGIYFYDTVGGSAALDAALTSDVVKELLEKFVFAKVEVKKGSEECKKYKVTSSNTILIVNPAAEKPEASPVRKITGKKTAKDLAKELEEALKKFEKK